MAVFTYKAKDRAGQVLQGTLEADSRTMVVNRLQSMGYFPISVQDRMEPAPGAIRLPTAIRGAKAKPSNKRGAKLKTRNITMFYRQMSDLVGAGVPLVKALGIVKTQAPDPDLANLISQIDRDVQGGDTFARALEKHPRVFSKLSTAMIHAGETGGLLDEVLVRLADFAEAEEELRGKILSALAYPVIMIFAGIGAVMILLTYVIPKITGVFSELNQALPWMTQILITASHFLGTYWWAILAAIPTLIFGVGNYRKTDAGRLAIDRMLLRVPALGEVILKREIASFTRTFGSLLRNGVAILNALEISAEVLTNRAIIKDIEKIPEGIAEGRGIAGTLRNSKYFPPVVINMIAIGEETGNLPGVLLKVAGTYETQVDRAVKTLTSIIEPVIILSMGVVVGFIVIAILLPIFSLDPSGGGG